MVNLTLSEFTSRTARHELAALIVNKIGEQQTRLRDKGQTKTSPSLKLANLMGVSIHTVERWLDAEEVQ